MSDTQQQSNAFVNVDPKDFESALLDQAQKHPMRIVLPEGEDSRVQDAVKLLIEKGAAKIVLLGDPKKVAALLAERNVPLDNIEIVEPSSSPKLDAYAQKYFEEREHKGISLEEAKEQMLDPIYFATMMVHLDDVEGMVAGAATTSAHTIRPAFEFIRAKPSHSIISGSFLMCMKDQIIVFADCAINDKPEAEELADIAIHTADTAKMFGIEPRVAILSFATGFSAKGPDVDRVREATRIAKEKAPHYAFEGPIQYDAALDPAVAEAKLPGSPVAGKATVFIFPDLNAGNIAYKAVQRAAGIVAVGPILQGLNKPVNDLSRGCTVPDIINTVALTVIQAQADKGLI